MRTITEEKTILNAAIAPPSGSKKNAEASSVIKIQSRFGQVEADTATKISFKHGLLGIPSAISFCITDLPGVSNDQFKLLQCMEDYDLSFIIVPSQYDNQLIEKEDLDDACSVLNIKINHLLLLFIVTVHDKNKERTISVNAKAPVFVDASNNTATQYVFQNQKYEIQHLIS